MEQNLMVGSSVESWVELVAAHLAEPPDVFQPGLLEVSAVPQRAAPWG